MFCSSAHRVSLAFRVVTGAASIRMPMHQQRELRRCLAGLWMSLSRGIAPGAPPRLSVSMWVEVYALARAHHRAAGSINGGLLA